MDQITSKQYIDHLLSSAGNAEAIEIQQQRFDSVAEKISAKIKALLRPETVASIILQIGLRDIERHNVSTEFELSDFSGHARHLRALIATTNFSDRDSAVECEDIDELFEQCGLLWKVLADRSWIESLKPSNPAHPGDDTHRAAALSMSLLDTFQQEITYYEFVKDHILALFSDFSKQIIEPATSLCVTEVVHAFDHVLDYLIPERMNLIREASSVLYAKHEEFKGAAQSFTCDADMDKWIEEDPDRARLGNIFKERSRKIDSLFEFDVKDFEPVLGSKASAFLEFFSFIPNGTYEDYCYPLDNDIVRSRPFAELQDGKYLLFDMYRAGFSPLYRIPELFESDRQKQRLYKQRDKLLERDAAKYIGEVFRPDLQAESYYIPFSEEGKLAERDLLLFNNGTLLIVESKAKPLRSIGRHGANLVKIRDDIKATIKEGYEQACSVVNYIDRSDKTICLFDKNGNVTDTLDKSAIKQIVPVVFLDSYFGLLATDPTIWLSKDEVAGYPWIIDRDTFRTIALRVDSPEKLIDFLTWRIREHGRFNEADEATIAGYFVQHGPVPLPNDGTQVRLDDSYDKVFDAAYFRSKGMDIPDPVADENPVWSTMRRDGDQLLLEIDGKEYDRLNLESGVSHRDLLKERRKRRKRRKKLLKKRKKK
ncbi:hypothetical protein [Mariniblastus fucicola]|uniref:Nuclease-related domain protein n=1 Tax=Mariniblastus fucicola TaxID=980251 RepID=A0A5B9P896_9BACT|nr:hypothetical protein [Mariniblastus fucicola]QEG22927.1 hypothetical protein MFFC18_28150 [Mariniblastus fucicola]